MHGGNSDTGALPELKQPFPEAFVREYKLPLSLLQGRLGHRPPCLVSPRNGD